jgi:hypothetical protein
MSAHEVTIFASAHVLHNCREQRPRNKCNVESSVTDEVGRVYYTLVDLLLISFLYHRT